MSAPFKKSITAAFSAPFYYEFTNQGIDKARALDEMLLKLGDFKRDNHFIWGWTK